jgi:hypothetical protein
MTSIRDNAVLIAKSALYDDGWNERATFGLGLSDDDIDGIALTVVRRLTDRGFLRSDVPTGD